MADVIERNSEVFPLGSAKLATFEVTMDGTAAVFTQDDHGFSNILFVGRNNEVSEADGLVQKNKDASGDAIGSIYLTGFTDADVVSLLIIGS